MKDYFNAIHKWYGNRPQIQPPHVRDLLALDDNNFRHEQYHARSDEDDHPENEPHTEDPMDASKSDLVAYTFLVTVGGNALMIGPHPRTRLSPGVIPYFLSTSETSEFNNKRQLGNTGIRKKSLSWHNIIVEATKASGKVMAFQMRDMAKSNHELERNKIEIQLKLFTEQMAYQREKDRRLYENIVIANENTHLAILKQREVVSCLAQL